MFSRHGAILLLVSLLFLSLFLGGCSGNGGTGPEAAGDATAGEAPVAESVLALERLNGGTVDLADYRGQVVLVNFWASWCAPCRIEMPALDEYYEAHREEGFVLLAVNAGEPRARASGFMDEYDFTFPVFLDEEGAAADYFGGVRGLPVSFVLDGRGEIAYRHVGMLTPADLEAHVTPLLQGAN